MNWRWLLQPLWTVAGIGLLSLPLLLYGKITFKRPPQTDLEQTLFQGIRYRREFRSTPRPMMLHIVTVDLTANGVRALVTPGEGRSIVWETNARTTSEFLTEFGLQLAVNASFFHPFDESTPWNYYPHTGDQVGVVGQAISNSAEYSSPLKDWAMLCITQRRAQILTEPKCPSGTEQAVAGSAVVVQNGRSVLAGQGSADSDANYSRTAVAVDRAGKTLWIIAVDDKQWLYSEGVSLEELAQIAIAIGASSALNLDGGGSTTLVSATTSGYQVLNSPIHTKIPMRERPVANHLGFYALPTQKP